MKFTTSILTVALLLVDVRTSDAYCCKHGDRKYSSCTVCPAHWYTSCPSYYSDVGAQGCGFLGCKLKCNCNSICGCYDANNNIDRTYFFSSRYLFKHNRDSSYYKHLRNARTADAKCRRGGDSSATCNDQGQTSTSYTCDCSTGYYDHNGNCLDYNACEGGHRSCRDSGDSQAACVDLAAPSTGFSCACSAGFHDDGGVCEPNKCNALTLSDGMIGTGSDACYNGLVLNGVFDKGT